MTHVFYMVYYSSGATSIFKDVNEAKMAKKMSSNWLSTVRIEFKEGQDDVLLR